MNPQEMIGYFFGVALAFWLMYEIKKQTVKKK